MTGPNIDSPSAPSHAERELSKKEWRRPVLRKLPIAATATGGGTGKSSGAHNDGSGSKSGDVSSLS
jgi:hypothetical protein